MKKQPPSQFRFLLPTLIASVPLIGVSFWLYVMNAINVATHQPEAVLAPEIQIAVFVCLLFGAASSAYVLWADFIRGDYYLDRMSHRDRL